MKTYLNPTSIQDNSIASTKLDSNTFKTVNGNSIFGTGDVINDGSINSSKLDSNTFKTVNGNSIFGTGDVINDGSINSSKLDSNTFKTVNGNSIFGIGDVINDGSINSSKLDSNTFKTVNGNSIFGTGDIITRKEIIEVSGSAVMVMPNIYQKHKTITPEIHFHLITNEYLANPNYLNEYLIEFTTHPDGTSVTLSEDIKWANGEIPIFENNCTYQISIINNLGVCVKFA